MASTTRDRRDEIEAAALYELFEEQMVPPFLRARRRRSADAVAGDGRHTLSSLGPKVQATRMLRDYVAQLYSPAAQSYRRLSGPSADAAAGGTNATVGYAGAKHLAAWKKRVSAAWPAVRVEHIEAHDVADALEFGTVVSLRAIVALGDLGAADVDVQVAYGRVDEHDEIANAAYASLRLADKRDDGSWVYEGEMTLDRTGPFGYSVRVLPTDPLLASPAELGLIAVPADGEGMVTGDLR